MSTELNILERKEINIKNDLSKAQENFLNSSLGKVINNAVDIGLRYVMPDLIEDEIINIKDSILENGLQEGLKQAVSSAVNLGKSALGIITGEFENVNQIEIALKKGGIIDTVSDLLDFSIKRANEAGILDSSISTIVKNGKNTILETIEEKIENTLQTQAKSIEKLQSYCDKWNEHYKQQNFEKMESSYKNIEKYLNKVIPLENTLKEARKIENLHNLIKNNGKDFNLTENEKKLAERLVI